MNTKSCEYLTAIADASSLSGAASVLGISQPTLSSFLQAEEKNLGYALFERTGRHLVPTQAGLIYLDACRRILQVKHQTYTSISNLGSRQQETIRIGATSYTGTMVFSNVYPGFYQRFQGIRIDIRECYMSAMMEDIRSGGLSLGLGTIAPSDEDSFSFASQGIEELVLCVPTHHPLAYLGSDSVVLSPTADIRDFADTPFVMWGSGTTNRRLISSYLSRAGVIPTVIYESNNALLVDTMLQKGLGIGFLPKNFCRPGQNRVYFSMDPPILRISCVIFRQGHILTEAERYLIYLVAKNHQIEYENTQRYYNDRMTEICNEFEKS